MTETTSLNETFFRITSSKRYDEVIKLIKKGRSVWTLADAEGCLIIELGNDKVLPIWPTQDLAKVWGEKDYPLFQALEIGTKDWQEKWLPGMANDGFQVGVAPNLAGECIVASAEEHAHDLKA